MTTIANVGETTTDDVMPGERSAADAKARVDNQIITLAFCSILFYLLSPSLYSIALLAFASGVLTVRLIVTAVATRSDWAKNYPFLGARERIHALDALPRLMFAFVAVAIIISLEAVFGFGLDSDEIVDELRLTFLTRQGEYLFFIGMTMFSLLLLAKRRTTIAAVIFSLAAAAIFSLALLWVIYFEPLNDFLRPIGIDSLSEASNFEWSEAKFYISTLRQHVHPNISPLHIAIYSLVSVALFSAIRRLARSRGWREIAFLCVVQVLAVVLIVAAIRIAYTDSFAQFLSASRAYTNAARNFDNVLPSISLDGTELTVVVYIGESTTAMNMSLYGYPRDTTPRLDALKNADENLLVFDNVFSTHTHTTPSLLEAFSFGFADDNQYLPIHVRKRSSLIDTLIANEVPVYLISNQGQAGTWNRASSIIFRNANRTFSTDSRASGNRDTELSRPFDHDFFEQHLQSTLLNNADTKKSVVFLHSYAGHGFYLDHIPEKFRRPVDDFVTSRHPTAVVGENAGFVKNIDAYDSAIRYIDYSVSEVIESIKSFDGPVVFIYFADHGESVYTASGHDSIRFIHEMVRVPYLMFFNDAAKSIHPDKFAKYADYSRQTNISTLAQLPSTIIDLLGATMEDASFRSEKLIGSRSDRPIQPIVVRGTLDGYTYVNLNVPSSAKSGVAADKTDRATVNYSISQAVSNAETITCYHRANSLGKAIRGALVSNCLEVDLMVESDGTLDVNHPPAESAALQLQEIIDIVSRQGAALWIDGKNLASGENCSVLLRNLQTSANNGVSILIEFPPNTSFSDTTLLACSAEMRKLGYRTSYYINTDRALRCSLALDRGTMFSATGECVGLQQDVSAAYKSKIFSDLSFDYRALSAMEEIDAPSDLRWNAWGVPAKNFGNVDLQKFGLLILNNSDPNHR